MSRDLTQPERDALESLIDAAGLSPVLEALSEICAEKADHIESTYTDSAPLARRWREACGVIGCAVPSLPPLP